MISSLHSGYLLSETQTEQQIENATPAWLA